MTMPVSSLETEKYYSVRTQQLRSPAPKAIKNNKLQKIVFGTDRQLYYFMGKLKKKDLARINFFFELEGDIYYEDSNTLYRTTEVDDDGELLSETFYHKSGGVHMVKINEAYDDCVRMINYAQNGSISEAFTNKTYKNVLLKDHPRRGTVHQAYWTKYDIKPNVLRRPGHVYVGWPHIGSLHTDQGYVLTGFHYPLEMELGNASVLFLENVKTDSCFWTLIIDGKIRELVPASIDEKPDIEALYRNTDIEVLNFQQLGTEDGKWAAKGSSKDKMKRMYEQEMVTMQTKNLQSLNGYGISLTHEDITGAGDKVNLRIGFFQNGQLHGLGYDGTLQYDLGYTPKNTSLANINGIDWKVDFGTFTRGALSRGGGIFTEKAYAPSLDVFSETFDSRYKWTGRIDFPNLSTNTIPFSQVSKDFYFYLPKLNRRLAAQQIDFQNKTVTLATDKEGEFMTFTSKDDLWAFKSDINSYQVSCPTTATTPNYVQKQVPLFQYPEYSTTTRRVTGVYFDKIITTRSYVGPGTTVYTEKVVQDGYKQDVCPKCNGKGYLIKDKQEGAFCKIDFSQ